MDEIKCEMVGCDYAEYDSKLQANICTYGPMCKILVLECEIDYLKKQLKSLYDAAKDLNTFLKESNCKYSDYEEKMEEILMEVSNILGK